MKAGTAAASTIVGIGGAAASTIIDVGGAAASTIAGKVRGVAEKVRR